MVSSITVCYMEKNKQVNLYAFPPLVRDTREVKEDKVKAKGKSAWEKVSRNRGEKGETDKDEFSDTVQGH